MPHKDLEVRKQYLKEWYLKNKDRQKRKRRRYYLKNRNLILIKEREIRRRDREKYKNYDAYRYKVSLESWLKIIPKETICEICGKKIYFNNNKTVDAIHFDHKNGRVGLRRIRPTRWLSRNEWSEENELKWKSFNFGYLCLMCNRYLPTCNRKNWLKNLNKYILSDNKGK